MADEKPKKNQGLQIQVDEATANGVYANMALINHTDMDFTIDFLYIQPQAPKASVRSRVITSPVHMKRLVTALQENLRRYEERYGTIQVEGPIGEPAPKGTYN